MVSEDFLPNIGGMSAHVYGLSRALAKRGHSVTVLGGRRSPDPPAIGDSRIEVISLGPVLFGRLRHVSFLLAGLRVGWGLVRNRAFDVVHWHGLWSDSLVARLLARRQGSLAVFTNHSSLFYRMVASPPTRGLVRRFIGKPDLCIAPSRELADLSRLTFSGVHTVYIPNGTDVEAFLNGGDKDAVKRSLGLDPARPVVLAPRRLVAKNGLEFLIRSVPLLQAPQRPVFCLIGDGPERERLQRLARTLGVAEQVRFVGARPLDAMPSLYIAADLVVIPSLIEATSLAAIEAMAAGVPVIATSVGGLKDLLADGKAGVLVPPASPQALADAIGSLLTDDARRQRLARAGPEVALAYSWDSVAASTELAYESVMDDREKY